jgi:DNA-directed RNA polymerase specialized sigma24 family protein
VTISDERTDRQLWTDASRRDGEAFGTLFRRHARAVYNHCFRLTGSWTIAEDSTSLTFLTAWRRRTDVRLARDSALPWLLAVATNVSQHQQRSARRARALTERLSADPPEVDHADDVAARLDDERRMTEVLRIVGRFPAPSERRSPSACGRASPPQRWPEPGGARYLREPALRAADVACRRRQPDRGGMREGVRQRDPRTGGPRRREALCPERDAVQGRGPDLQRRGGAGLPVS